MSFQALGKTEVTLFNEIVKQEYQHNRSKLRNTVTHQTLSGGEAATWTVYDSVGMQEHASYTAVPNSSLDVEKITVLLKDYVSRVPVSWFHQGKVNFDMMQRAAEAIVAGMGRKQDQIIIDALTNSGSTKTVAKNISGADANLSLAALQKAKELLDDDDVPDEDRHAAVTPGGLRSLLENTQVTSADFADVKALVRGDITSYMGFQFHRIGNMREETGLPLSVDDRENYFYHKDAVGLAIGREPQMLHHWDNLILANVTTGVLSAQASRIDNLGIVIVTVDDTL